MNFLKGAALGVAVLVAATAFGLVVEWLKQFGILAPLGFLAAVVILFFGYLNWRWPQ